MNDNDQTEIINYVPERKTNWHLIVFSAFLITGFSLALWKLQSSLSFLDATPAFILAFLIFMFSCSALHKKKLTKPVSYLTPLYIGLSVSFAIISFIFGLHSNVFLAYDESNVIHPNRFKWFQTHELLNFPLHQLGFRKTPEATIFNFTALKASSDSIYNIIIVDKTGSLLKPKVPTLGNHLLKEIDDKSDLNYIIKKNHYEISDLIPACLITKLSENSINSRTKNFTSVYYYTGLTINGETGLQTILRDAPVSKDKDSSSTLIEDYLKRSQNFKSDSLRADKGTKEKTSFNVILAQLQHKIDRLTPGRSINIWMISDFIPSDPKEPVPNILQLTGISQVTMFVLAGKDKGNTRSSPPQFIYNMTKDFSYLKRTTIVNLNYPYSKDAELKIDDAFALASCQHFSENDSSNVPFYMPYVDFESNQEAETKIILKETLAVNDTNPKITYALTLNDFDNPSASFPVFYYTTFHTKAKRAVTRFGDTLKVYIDNNTSRSDKYDTLTLSLPHTSNYPNDRLFLNISSLRINKTLTVPVSFLPLLSEPTSYCMLVFYSIFIISVTLLLILPNIYVFILINNREMSCPSPLHSLLLSFPIAFGAAFLVYCFYLFDPELQNTYLSILLAMLLATIPRMVSTYRKKRHSYKNQEFKAIVLELIVAFYTRFNPRRNRTQTPPNSTSLNYPS